ncbi:NAD(P)-dependent dehydrogenase, short-chain alcohol dehydrogenase family [Sphingobacterium nematocida]|uniref:NAD(P)-dependent dehydrogenase, short-chain alcohol dehydrogenase family n=1 Tax=Sphingobacterium nematocida TaxID=1513896 RepID=A0A1T5CI63_9SPHI|nr:glucose 1-dehydrogenase [Sphingobacterium nematocida]SKB59137.1 NAD(P)-dependent dehydrogenase, short-chain alcohol dehydrogenase family [Sphingobacterium nematocida]
MSKLVGKVAIVTGGGSGIGKAISELFAEQGAFVHILDLDQTGSEAVVAAIRQKGGDAMVHVCSVADQGQVEEIVAKIEKVDILVNNAGIAHVGNLEHCTEADFERVFNVNVKGAYNALYAVVPRMKENGGGAILNLASIAAVVGITDRFAYSMSKGAIYAMSMSVARDYMKDNIRSNSISPARVHTPFVDGFIAKNYPGKESEMFEKLSQSQPIGRMAKPEEIAKLALFLCSEDAAFITGNDYPIDGGFIKLNN